MQLVVRIDTGKAIPELICFKIAAHLVQVYCNIKELVRQAVLR